MKSLIKTLVETTGPSGYESQIREIIKNEIKKHTDEIRTDALGNLIAVKGSSNSDGVKIMLSAHMDEIGIIVTHIEKDGFARFTNIGGVYSLNCLAGRVRFLNGVEGVIGGERIKDPKVVPSLDQLFIDVGATSADNCPIKVGDVAAFDRPFLDMGDKLVSKAMDDRIGAAILVETLRGLKSSPHQIYFVFSVQEEVGVRGATTAAFGINPDIGLAVDITRSADTPNCTKMNVSLGKGPAIKVRDGGMLADPRVIDWMVDAAKKINIPYQLEVLQFGSTDARAIQLSQAGVPSGCLSIPCRYAHTPSEMVHYQDVKNSVNLLLELLTKPVHLP